jgi:ribonuclease M5
MLKEVIIVEGKNDIARVKMAVEAECIATGGYSRLAGSLEKIKCAYEKRGIIILTDPDSAGERIRGFLAKKFPQAKHAFVAKRDACAKGDLGVEQAAPEIILEALAKVKFQTIEAGNEFSRKDLFGAGLDGAPDAAIARAQVGRELGIGYANAKTFLARLNNYGITRENFNEAVGKINGKN